jgi:trypsin
LSASRIISHPSYNPSTIDFDIALVIVSVDIEIGGVVQAVGLAASGSDPASGTTVRVAGWGTTSQGGSIPATLRQVDVQVVARTTCNSAYGGITARMVCAGVNGGGKDSCQVSLSLV